MTNKTKNVYTILILVLVILLETLINIKYNLPEGVKWATTFSIGYWYSFYINKRI